MPINQNHPNHDPTNEGCGVPARTSFMGDPRVNEKQMEAIFATIKFDREALVMGIDENMLVVVRARVGVPKESKSWAVKRNGDPTAPGRLFQPFVTKEARNRAGHA